MPGRIVPLVNNEIYHVFNRGIDRRPTFTTRREFIRSLETVKFYRFHSPHMRLSKFLRLEEEKKRIAFDILKKRGELVNIFAFCLMPNHFHFQLQQKVDNGIAKFLSNFQNSYTRYFNTRHERDGSLFLDQFKAVRIETNDQLIHVNRYIHLNPYTSYVVKTLEEMGKYEWSSLQDYFLGKDEFVHLKPVMEFFRSIKEYKKFVFDQADYQRKLKKIEHLLFE